LQTNNKSTAGGTYTGSKVSITYFYYE
jgi:hypothetical protein